MAYITGLSHECPSNVVKQHAFESIVKTLYPGCADSIGLQKLIQFNERTGIDLRWTIQDHSKLAEHDATPPPIEELSRTFRTAGVDLSVTASRRALEEARVNSSDITHIVAVTCTDQGNPGFDFQICQALGLDPSVERTLLHGVGCAGGLSIIRMAANFAAAATQRGQPARILVVSCELCSLFLQAELYAAFQDNSLHIAPVLFSDAAAAVVVCNQLALQCHQRPIFEVQICGTMVVPNTLAQMSYDLRKNGMIATISKEVPQTAVGAIPSLFNKLACCLNRRNGMDPCIRFTPDSFDWAIHPGGAAILRGARRVMGLTDSQMHASLDVYKSKGNSSSASVLIVLDQLRRMSGGREQVVATSFGPGITVEMVLMRRHQFPDGALNPKAAVQCEKPSWRCFQPRLLRAYARLIAERIRRKELRVQKPLM